MKLVIARGNHCSADNAIQQPSLDRQGAANVLASSVSTHNPYSKEKKETAINYETVGLWAEYLSTTDQWIRSQLSAYPDLGGGEGEASGDLGRQWQVSCFWISLSFFLFSEKHLTATWAHVAAPAVTSSNIAFAIQCTHFFQFSHSTTIISLNITYRSVFLMNTVVSQC